MKAIIMRWIPASGKTTWAEQYCCENENWVRISKDDIRILFPQSKEKQIHKIQYDMIRRSFEVWKNVIIDNTHISEPSIQKIKWDLEKLWYEYEVKVKHPKDVGNSLWQIHEAIKRNDNRTKKVPKSVIWKMWLELYKIKIKIIICDIDWTIADPSHRIHLIKQKKHKEFYDACVNDRPIHQVLDIIKDMDVIFVSGRPDTHEKQTIQWLEDNGIRCPIVLMRNGWDHRDDYIIKEEIYERCLKHMDITCVFDDRKRVVDMRRSKWLYVFDCNQSWEVF